MLAMAERLSEREREVLALVAQGHCDKQIASILCISVDTVDFHMREVFRKLEARSRAHATFLALVEGYNLHVKF